MVRKSINQKLIRLRPFGLRDLCPITSRATRCTHLAGGHWLAQWSRIIGRRGARTNSGQRLSRSQYRLGRPEGVKRVLAPFGSRDSLKTEANRYTWASGLVSGNKTRGLASAAQRKMSGWPAGHLAGHLVVWPGQRAANRAQRLGPRARDSERRYCRPPSPGRPGCARTPPPGSARSRGRPESGCTGWRGPPFMAGGRISAARRRPKCPGHWRAGPRGAPAHHSGIIGPWAWPKAGQYQVAGGGRKIGGQPLD